MNPSITVLIPTFNEPELLAACVDSLQAQEVPLSIVVINAGKPVSIQGIHEIKVDSIYFYTLCLQAGIEHVRENPTEFVLFSNADTVFLPGSVAELLNIATSKPKSIAVSPAYDSSGALIYSRQSDWGFLLYGKLIRDWTDRTDAPTDPILADLAGGQGVLLPFEAVHEIDLDVENFPQYASDHDLWLRLRKKGYQLWVAPKAGVENVRGFNAQRKRSFLATLFYRMNSEYSPESARIMWRLRRKHLALPLAVLSWVIAFGLRWTLGLPKIIRRS